MHKDERQRWLLRHFYEEVINFMKFIDFNKDPNKEFKKSTIGAHPIVAESNMNKFHTQFIKDFYELLNDNLNIRQFQNIKGDVEKIDNAVKRAKK
ncbi:10607_t:CDS:2 [Entrophospora sp. SA101]|nr:10607_t:CDS:2 [Entrophospora sp. SA101]